ncbi:hypothetical protein ACLOJK_037461, partial [Asimina triloba]
IHTDEEEYDEKIQAVIRLFGRNDVRRNNKDDDFWHMWYQMIKCTIMAPKRNVDKGKTLMVEEEPRGPRTR